MSEVCIVGCAVDASCVLEGRERAVGTVAPTLFAINDVLVHVLYGWAARTNLALHDGAI